MDWHAQWIWHPPIERMTNFYLYARKALTLAEPPAGARLLITASSLYKLYVNGQSVGRGPNPADPSYYYYDVHDVAEHLRAGENVIAVEAYNYGAATPADVPGVLNQNWGRGGLLAELLGPAGEVLAASDETWRVLQAPPWDADAPVNCTLLGDYKEIYDSRREIPGWREPGFDDSAWLEPALLGRPPVEPWTMLIEREIPFLLGERVYPAYAAWESASVTYSWRDDWEVSREQSLVPAGPHRRGDTGPARVRKTHDDFTPAMLLDFGRDVTGYPEIHIADSAGGVIDVLYGEDPYMVRVDRFILRDGPQVLQPFNRRTFRYMKLQFPQTPGAIDIAEVSMAMSTYPVEARGEFRCSDERLNRIWAVGAYTMRMSMLDHFVDCPWRERTIYGGDVYAENLIAHYAFGDPRMNRKVLRQMFAIQHDGGALPPWGPYSGGPSFYPAWGAFTGLGFVDHYWLTGDREFLDELWARFAALVEWNIRQLEGNDAYLMGTPAERGDYADWMQAEKVQYPPSQNYCVHALLARSAELAGRAGHAEQAARWQAAAQRMGQALETHLARPGDPQGGWHQRHQSGQYDRGLRLWAGLPDAAVGRQVAAELFEPQTGRIRAPFHGLFVTEGLFRYGEDRRAVDFVRTFWGDMLDRGATTFWDNFSLDWPDGVLPDRQTSLCHGWAAGPTWSLPAHVLGVQPDEPGFARVLIEPRPADLHWAAGTVPTPAGAVEVSWQRTDQRFRLELVLPEGCPARVSLPPVNAPRPRVVVDGTETPFTWDADRRVLDVPPGRHVVELG